MTTYHYIGSERREKPLEIGDRLCLGREVVEVVKIEGQNVYLEPVRLDLSEVPAPVQSVIKALFEIIGVKAL